MLYHRIDKHGIDRISPCKTLYIALEGRWKSNPSPEEIRAEGWVGWTPPEPEPPDPDLITDSEALDIITGSYETE